MNESKINRISDLEERVSRLEDVIRHLSKTPDIGTPVFEVVKRIQPASMGCLSPSDVPLDINGKPYELRKENEVIRH